jgi:hypothetical protein
LALYRDPSGNLSEFLYRLESPSLIYCIPTVVAANNNNNNGITHVRVKHSSKVNSDPSYYLAHSYNNSFRNIQFKFSTTKETESIIKSLKSNNTCGYDEISTRMQSSRMWCPVGLVRTDISEECVVSTFRAEKAASGEQR